MKLLITSLLAFFCCTASYSQTKSSVFTHLDIIDKQVIPQDTAIRKGVLDNGLTYYVRKSDANAKHVNFNLLAKGGSVIEEDNELGIAHFVEHLVFKGTKHFPGHGVQDFFRRNGIPFGHDSNANTGFTYVRYVLNSIDASNEQLLDSCLLLMRDFAGNATIADADVESERSVIVEEWRTRKADVNEQIISNGIYNNSVYSKRNPIGNLDIIRNCTPSLVRNFYKKWYQPQNLAIVVVGDICPDKMVEKIRSMFGSMKRGSNVVADAPSIPDSDTPYIIIDKVNAETMCSLGVFVRLPVVSADEVKTIGGQRTFALHDKIKDILKKKFDAIANKRTDVFSPDVIKMNAEGISRINLMGVGTSSVADDWLKAFELICKRIELTRRKGFVDKDWKVDWNHASPKYNDDSTAIDFDADTTFSSKPDYSYNHSLIDNIAKTFLGNGVNVSYKTNSMVNSHIQNTITSEQLNNEFNRIYSGKNMTVLLMFPGSTKALPTEKDVLAVMNRVKGMSDDELSDVDETAAKKFDTLPVDSLDINPVPGTVKKIKVRNDSITDVYLSNGVKVVLMERKMQDIDLRIYFHRPSGYSVLNDDEISYNSLLGKCMRYYTFEGRRTTWMVDAFDDRMDYEDRYNDSTHIDGRLKAMYATLTSTEVDTVTFNEEIKKLQMSALQRSNKNYEALMKVNNLPSVDMRRLLPPTMEDMARYNDIERFGNIIKDYKSNYNGSLIVISGKFDTDSIMPAIMPAILKYVASLPSKSQPVKRMVWDADHYKTTNTTIVEKIERNIPISRTCMYYTWEKGFKYSSSVHAHNQVLNSVLRTLILDKIRIEHGDVYTLSCSVEDKQIPVNSMCCSISFVCAPDKREKVVKDVEAIVNDMAYGDLITQPLIDSYIKEREQKAINYKDNDYSIINDYIKRELGEIVEKYGDTSYIKKVTPASLKAHLKRLLKKGNLHIGYLTTE